MKRGTFFPELPSCRCTLPIHCSYRSTRRPILRLFIGLPRSLRVVFSIILLAHVGFVLGTAFPIGFRRMSAERAELIPWTWGMNGIGSVLGSVLAMVVAINNGLTATLLAAAACYLVALCLAPTKGRG